ncbi:MAG: hypothetical protein Q8M01_09150 [Rubrivivax sp.]|nr:hypothetical protein [Rubrivivax sp.]
MSHFRFVPMALALAAASTLIACNTAPAMPMGSAPASSMVTPERMAAMDGQMKNMRDMHTKMMNAKTPEERQALMGEHMKAMQGGMGMMNGMSGMSGMGGMSDSKGIPADMAQRHAMMTQHMAMMQTMMDMMSQRMPPAQGKQ